MAHVNCALHHLGTAPVVPSSGSASTSSTVHRSCIQYPPGVVGLVVQPPYPKHVRYKRDSRERDRAPAVGCPRFVRSIHSHGCKMRYRGLCSLEPYEKAPACQLVELGSAVAKEVDGKSKVVAAEAEVVLDRPQK